MATAVLSVMLASACSGISANQDFNPATEFSGLRTWDWMPNPTRPTGDSRADNAIIHQRIRSAIETGLQGKGLTKATSGEPSFRVGYQIVLDDRVDYQTVNYDYGAGWGSGGVYGRDYGPTMGTRQTTARTYTMGTPAIAFLDTGSKELACPGSALR
jgi:hypothetical protein